MKGLRILVISTLLLASLSLFAGCSDEPFAYTFRQDLTNVIRVEICSYDSYYKTATILTELSDEDANNLLSAIAALPCYEHFPGDHTLSYGPVIILIHYSDGETEKIGPHNTGYISPTGVSYTRGEHFEETDILDLIKAYTDPSLLPDLSNYYRKK